MESLARGGTRWKRFAVVMVPSVAATAAIGVAIAQGALAASFSVSGQQFKVTAKTLDGDGFVQYGALDKGQNGQHPVAVVGMNSAEITKLCQSVVVPVPIFGDVTMQLKAGGGKEKVLAKKLYIDADDLQTNATFTNVDIGVSVDDTGAGGKTPGPAKPGEGGRGAYLPGSFAQQADKVHFEDVKQRAWATTAGTFKLSGLHMNVSRGKNECY
ncbi:cholesterol esterase [Streptomyces sp. WAC 06783]|uniref:DUF6230 family protein n=1 Tax=Streptomyces TaxID=1883 RepID=UPI0004C9D231|nr:MULTISPECIES: DUF6230 family protein [Streptomyces]KOT89303.1 cholesterol esterase [Streptomyces rimosus subsp. pseudoverticillatus]RSO11163.1 cholesterol esterase [Streptomyces sp. WAC 06783]